MEKDKESEHHGEGKGECASSRLSGIKEVQTHEGRVPLRQTTHEQ